MKGTTFGESHDQPRPNHHRGQKSKSLFLFIIAGISFTS